MIDDYPNLSPIIGGAEQTLPGCKIMYRYGVAIPSTLLAQQSKVKKVGNLHNRFNLTVESALLKRTRSLPWTNRCLRFSGNKNMFSASLSIASFDKKKWAWLSLDNVPRPFNPL